jgi:hypothetical protein
LVEAAHACSMHVVFSHLLTQQQHACVLEDTYGVVCCRVCAPVHAVGLARHLLVQPGADLLFPITSGGECPALNSLSMCGSLMCPMCVPDSAYSAHSTRSVLPETQQHGMLAMAQNRLQSHAAVGLCQS